MPVDLAALRGLIQSDTALLAHWQAGAVGALVAALNTLQQGLSVREPVVPKWRVLAWAAQGGRMAKLLALANNPDPEKASLGVAALKIVDTLPDVDLDAPEFRALLDLLNGGTVLSNADKAALLALGDRSPASRAEVECGGPVTDRDVETAMKGGA